MTRDASAVGDYAEGREGQEGEVGTRQREAVMQAGRSEEGKEVRARVSTRVNTVPMAYCGGVREGRVVAVAVA